MLTHVCAWPHACSRALSLIRSCVRCTATIWNTQTQAFNYTLDQKLSMPDAGWGRISPFTLWFRSRHMNPWQDRERGVSQLQQQMPSCSDYELSSALTSQVQQSQPHLLPTSPWGESSWRSEWLATLPTGGDSKNRAAVKSFIQLEWDVLHLSWINKCNLIYEYYLYLTVCM